MGCSSLCDISIGEHELVNCGEYKLGGSSGIIIGSCGTELADPGDGDEIQALLTAGTAVLINDIRFSLPAGSPILLDSPVGCGTQKRVTADRTAVLFDANVVLNNIGFYNSLNTRKIAWILAYLCDSGTVMYIDAANGINTSAEFILTEQNNDYQRFEATFSWRNNLIPQQYLAPGGIFG